MEVGLLTSDAPAGVKIQLRLGSQRFVLSGTSVVRASADRVNFRATLGADPAEWFVALIAPDGKASPEISFRVNAPIPGAPTLSPNQVAVGSGATVLTVTAKDLHAGSVIRVNGETLATTAIISGGGITTGLRATIPAPKLASAGQLAITVFSPGPGGGTSASSNFSVVGSSLIVRSVVGAPVLGSNSAMDVGLLTSAAPEGVKVQLRLGSQRFVLSGTSVVRASADRVNFRATLGADPAEWFVALIAPDGKASPEISFRVNAPIPGAPTPSPNQVAVGSGATVLTVTAKDLHAGSVIRVNGETLATTAIISGGGITTGLRATIPAPKLASAGQLAITVFSPGPGGGTSASSNFSVVGASLIVRSVVGAPVVGSNSAMDVGLLTSGAPEGVKVQLRLGSQRFVLSGTSVVRASADHVNFRATLGADPAEWFVALIAPDGKASPEISFRVNAPIPGAPTLSPNQVAVGSGATVLTVTAKDLHAGSVIRVNGETLSTTAIISGGGITTALRATIPAPKLVSAGQLAITVFSPGPGGGTSASSNFSVVGASLIVRSVVGAPVVGSNSAMDVGLLTSGAPEGVKVQLRLGSQRFVLSGTSVVRASADRVNFRATLGADPAEWFVALIAPDGKASPEISFRVNAPIPGAPTLSPNQVAVGSGATVLTVTAKDLHAGSVIRVNGETLSTTAIISGGGITTGLRATIPAPKLASAGQLAITVFSPGPGGGTSASSNFSVVGASLIVRSVVGAPVVGSNSAMDVGLLTSGAPEGVKVQLRLGSQRFVLSGTSVVRASADHVNFRATLGADPAEWFVALIAPDGKASPEISFRVNAPIPGAPTLSPNQVAVGSGATVLTVTAKDLHAGSVIRVNGETLATTAIISGGGITTGLRATIPAPKLASAGQLAITVFSPGPGGGTSASSNFSVVGASLIVRSVVGAPVVGSNSAMDVGLLTSGAPEGVKVQLRLGSQRFVLSGTSVVRASADHVNFRATLGADPAEWFVALIAPDGKASPEISFRVNAPIPGAPTLSPNQVAVGSGATVLTVTAKDLHAGSVIRVNGETLSTTAIISGGGITTGLRATIPAPKLASAGQLAITVFSPGPGGGTSLPRLLSVGGGPISETVFPGAIWYPSPNFRVRRNGKRVDTIVIHTTEGWIKGDLFTLTDGTAVRPVSSHYLVGPDGTIYELVNPDMEAWHATYYNSRSIGIEVSGFASEAGTWNPANLESISRLIAFLAKKYDIQINHPTETACEAPDSWLNVHGIVAHSQIQTAPCFPRTVNGETYNAKSDPGPHFPWDRVLLRARELSDSTVVELPVSIHLGSPNSGERSVVVSLALPPGIDRVVKLQMASDINGSWGTIKSAQTQSGKVDFETDGDASDGARFFRAVVE